jgi:exopolysaccharide biosynthesis protein
MSNPPLVFNNAVIAYGNFNPTVPGDYDYVFPRTTIGVKTDPLGSVLYLVIADGEGIHGGHGATANQMGHFFKDVLGAQNAFAIDSGLSTEMVIQGTRQATPRRINTLTGEDATIQTVPSLQFLDETPTVFGAVANFIRVVYTPQVIGPP